MNPMFRLTTVGVDGAWGTDEFGTSSWGGNKKPAVTLTKMQNPYDELEQSRHRVRPEVVHKRLGRVIGARKWGSPYRRWRANYNAISSGNLFSLREFFDAGQFYLLPFGQDSSTEILVQWMENTFVPNWVGPEFWQISFTLEELPT